MARWVWLSKLRHNLGFYAPFRSSKGLRKLIMDVTKQKSKQIKMRIKGKISRLKIGQKNVIGYF